MISTTNDISMHTIVHRKRGTCRGHLQESTVFSLKQVSLQLNGRGEGELVRDLGLRRRAKDELGVKLLLAACLAQTRPLDPKQPLVLGTTSNPRLHFQVSCLIMPYFQIMTRSPSSAPSRHTCLPLPSAKPGIVALEKKNVLGYSFPLLWQLLLFSTNVRVSGASHIMVLVSCIVVKNIYFYLLEISDNIGVL